jgi:hypothetical protein
MDAQGRGREGNKLIVTKDSEIGQGNLCTSFRAKVEVRAEKFFEKLAGMKDVEDASADKLRQEAPLEALKNGKCRETFLDL